MKTKYLLLAVLLLFPLKGFTNEEKVYQHGKLLEMQTSIQEKHGAAFANRVGDSVIINQVSHRYNEYLIVVQIGDLAYVGEYDAKWRWSHKPGADWVVGDPIEVSLNDKNEMFLKRPDGKELKTKIVKKVRIEQPIVESKPIKKKHS